MSDIYLSLTETPSVVTLSQPVVSGALASTVTVANTVTVTLDADSLSALENVTVTVGAAISGTVTVANFPASQTVQGTVTVGSLPLISGSVTVNNFPPTQTIAGTVTANGGNFLNADNALITKDSATNVILLGGLAYSTTPTLSQIQALQTSGTGVLKVYQEETNWTDTNQGNQPRRASQQTPFPVQILGGSVTIGNTVTVSQSGSVTANSIFPRVTLIDGSGTVATANTAITVFASSSTRSYLLVQVTTGSAFVNVGATATTVNGINLTAGQGYSWETTIPQGIVSLISTTTSSRYVAKEA